VIWTGDPIGVVCGEDVEMVYDNRRMTIPFIGMIVVRKNSTINTIDIRFIGFHILTGQIRLLSGLGVRINFSQRETFYKMNSSDAYLNIHSVSG